ncbi:hypothetical protein TNCT_592121 [Trichonephila clavata]|uniref:Uncharacterized protein n=1 Tax=Trichonephila clavata TaxID=2740835 RepID=A0A8X6IMA1_TRICU|nr:hypothetical protein TNCT_592121 [Trichonephila clavata]
MFQNTDFFDKVSICTCQKGQASLETNICMTEDEITRNRYTILKLTLPVLNRQDFINPFPLLKTSGGIYISQDVQKANRAWHMYIVRFKDTPHTYAPIDLDVCSILVLLHRIHTGCYVSIGRGSLVSQAWSPKDRRLAAVGKTEISLRLVSYRQKNISIFFELFYYVDGLHLAESGDL